VISSSTTDLACSGGSAPKRKRRFRLGRRSSLAFWVSPALILIGVFAIYPVAYSVFISFFKYKLTDPTKSQTFVGFGNYLAAFADPSFIVAVRNSLVFVVGAVGFELLLGLALAVLLNRELPGMGIVRSLLIAPLTLTPLVVALVWGALYNADFGPVSYYLKQLGFQLGAGPIGEPSLALASLVVIDVWQWTPLMALLLFTGLRSQPLELHDAAQIDGASPWQRFLFVSLPLLKPTILVALVIRTMDALKLFDSVFAITGGGPGRSTEVVNYYIFKVGLKYFDIGYAAAMSNLLLIIIVIMSALYLRALRTSGRAS